MQRIYTQFNWKNKNGTSDKYCRCGSWQQHWINKSRQVWPSKCSVRGCDNPATLGAHIINSNVAGEFIIPACDFCNKKEGDFDIKGGTTLISANRAETCER